MAMHMYGLTLQKATAVTQAIYGNFSAPKAQEIVVTRGKILELLRPDDTGKVQSVVSWECFGIIRAIHAFRLISGKRDYIVVGSDSGRINVLQYDPKKNRFVKVHEETFGKSGCRRIVPGQYIASDPNGRAVMIGAIEKHKLVYILNRDASNALTISSPLEAHKGNTIVHAIVGVDNGFENPQFACLECNYSDVQFDEKNKPKPPVKMLTFYELDLGLNHVTRKMTTPCDPTANLLVSVPGGDNGPGGVLVCSENYVTYKNFDHDDVKVPLPRREGSDGVLIVTTTTHKQKNLFFFLVQTELGDIYKISLEFEADDVSDVIVKYFDTIPVANSICVLRTGFLFAASEYGDHYLFQIQGIGIGDETVETTTKDLGEAWKYFRPRKIKNLALIDEMESLCPVMDAKVADLVEEQTPQIYTLCGKGNRSSLRALRHGLAVTEMAVSELPGNPKFVWAVKTHASQEYCKYIVVSFDNGTIVLSIGERVTEVAFEETKILDTQTLSLSLLGENSLLQIHPGGIRHIRTEGRVNQWKTPGNKRITQCAVNDRQVAIALTGGDLVFFELDKQGQLMDIYRKEMRQEISALAIAPIPYGQTRSHFMAVGLYDNTVRLLSIDPNNPLGQLTLQACNAQPSSLLLTRMSADESKDAKTNLYLYTGLKNGVLIRCMVDPANGSLSDDRKRFLDPKEVRLSEVRIYDRPAVMAISHRTWLSYAYQGRFHMTPISYESLADVSSFSSEQCPEGIVAITNGSLRIVTLERLGDLFNTTTLPLRYTPRRMCFHPITNHIIVCESDNRTLPLAEKKELQKAAAEESKKDGAAKRPKTEEGKAKMEEEDEDEDDEEDRPTTFLGDLYRAQSGKWASCIRVVNPKTMETVCIEELTGNEAAFSCTILQFSKTDDYYLAVGTVKDLIMNPRKHSGGFIHLYKFGKDMKSLELVHKTPVHDVTLAMTSFDKKLLVGVGRFLRIYDLGRKKLLRKCENKNFPTTICSLDVKGSRIYVGDLCESFHLVKYKDSTKQFYIFADTTSPFYLTSRCLLDYNTVAGGDKFGNLLITRLPETVTEEKEEDPIGLQGKFGMGKLNSAANKMKSIVNFYVGEAITSLQKCALVPVGPEVIFYATVMGGLGIFIPFSSREDIEFFSHLEMHLRQENPPLCGRDHLAFRSYYTPAKECIDGDLCEQFSALDYSKQKGIAEELMCTPAEVIKKLEEIRNRVL
mmetsp:Transcript_2281/g.5207  ORF Transcript_2281/g.5207 Transcript_2281/m.5207 type:complete len:1210 (+) Transcript_2281:84-3713(+)